MVSDETLDKLGISLLAFTVLNILGLLVFIALSAFNEQDFSEELSTIGSGSFELTFTISNLCRIDIGVIIVTLILLLVISNKKTNN